MGKRWLLAALAALLLAPPRASAWVQIRPTPQQRAAWAKAGRLEMAARAARARRDYARAEDYYRAETQVPLCPAQDWTWIDLGLMQDRQGKRAAAFASYEKGFALSPRGSTAQGGSDEAAARFGAMLEDRGRHGDARECFYVSRRTGGGGHDVLDVTLNPRTTPVPLARSLLDVALGIAVSRDSTRQAEALADFRAAVRLAPGDPRPQYFLANGLRMSRRFTEAEAALQKVTKLDTGGRLRAATLRSLKSVHEHHWGFE